LSTSSDPDDPTAVFTAAPNPVATGQSVAFDASNSQPDGHNPHLYTISSYTWVWGDGTPNGSGANPSHTFSTAGTYNVQLTVQNSNGNTDTYTLPVVVNDPISDVTLQDGVDGYAGTEDTYVVGDAGNPGDVWNQSYGNLQYLRAWYYNSGQENQIVFIKFDLSSVPAGTLTGATLRMWIRRENMAPKDIQIHTPNGAWSETTTWNTKPATTDTGLTFNFPDTSHGTTIADPPTEYVDIALAGMLSTVQGWLNNPSNNHGIALVPTTNINADFWSSEYGTAQYRPRLTLQFQGGGPGPDATPPTVTASHAVLAGNVSDDMAAPSEVVVNGTISCPVSSGNWTTPNLAVSSGTNTFVLTATDASNNERTVNVVVTLP
ncbi:MAG TPA: DNRLRE domain-containing protein, partial [Planctomycetes bacterium]|nr:DNRLRE domain-containing protein [Planctomycetota bacterium]